MFKVIVAGGREFDQQELLFKSCYKILSQVEDEIEIVCGGATGADALGKSFAEHNSMKVAMFNADWKGKGKAAGILRNIEMGDYADALIAFWDGKSRGTKHMIEYMKTIKNKPVRVIRYNPDNNKKKENYYEQVRGL